MNDRDLSRPATRHRTSNAARPDLRRTANTRTSNELMEIPPLELTRTMRVQPITEGSQGREPMNLRPAPAMGGYDGLRWPHLDVYWHPTGRH